jgi:hypothetical protein
MTLLKIGQRIVNLDRATCIQDIPATRGSGKGRGKSDRNGRGGGIRVVFEKDNYVDFTDEDAEQLLNFVEVHSFLPPPLPVEPVEAGA